MVNVLIIKSVRKYAQDGVGAGPEPAPQRRAPLSHRRIETVDTSVSEHSWGAAVPGQPQQHPERIIELNTESVVLLLGICPPQAGRVQGRTKRLEKSYFDGRRATYKPAGDHIGPHRQRPPLTNDWITNDPFGSLFNRVQSHQLVSGWTIPKVAAELHTRPKLCLIQLTQLFRSEVPPDLREDFKYFCCNLCFGLDILPKVKVWLELHTAQIHLGRSEPGVFGSVLWKKARLSFGSVERDQISIAAIGECLNCWLPETGFVQAINHCLSTRHDNIPYGVCTCQVPVRNSAVICIPKGTGYKQVFYMQQKDGCGYDRSLGDTGIDIFRSNELPSRTIRIDLPVRKSEIQVYKPSGVPKDGSLLIRLVCHTLSKALEIWRDTSRASPCFSMSLLQICVA